MPEVLFEPRYAVPEVRDPDSGWLRELILDPFRPGREFGSAGLIFRDGGRVVRLILIAHRTLGLYLKYGSPDDTWLSLGDPGRLREVACPDDWEASAGLFVSPALAWLAVEEFCRTGGRSSAVRWIRPVDVPDGGNW